MLVFIDESGDTGLNLTSGSSRYFVIARVIFEDNSEAEACDERIRLLRKELGWNSNSEFHFKKNSSKVREKFLSAVSPYNFFYYGIVINKDPKKLWGDGFKNKESFYKYACSLVFEKAKDKLENAIVIIDQSGNLDFRSQLSKYLRSKMNSDGSRIKKLKQQKSSSNNLLQLADYIAGICARRLKINRDEGNKLRKIIAHREIYVQIWPK